MDNLILRSDAIKAACAGVSYSDIKNRDKKRLQKRLQKKIKNVPSVHVKPEWNKITAEEIKQND